MIHDISFNDDVQITVGDGLVLPGHLHVPKNAKGIILFAHGSGSSHRSARNRQVAGQLQQEGFATLLMDLLSEEENKDREKSFDVETLASRLKDLRAWVDENPHTEALTVGLFGASTGAAAALMATAATGNKMGAIVCRGGRVDMAKPVLRKIKSPVLLIVGSQDTEVLQQNRQAFDQLTAPKDLQVVEGAGHLFEEEGKMDDVAKLAVEWYMKHI